MTAKLLTLQLEQIQRDSHDLDPAPLSASGYTVLNALLAALAPLTEGWPTYGTTAIAVPPMVLAMVYVVIPLARKA
jgi:hypothetical protein